MNLKEHCGSEEGHTPRRHYSHTNPCGCSTDRQTDFAVCQCGAAYTGEVLTFVFFTCYDCDLPKAFLYTYSKLREK